MGSLCPAGVVGVVLERGGGQDQLQVPPGQLRVGAAHQRRHARDDGGRGGGAAELLHVAVGVLGSENGQCCAPGPRTVVRRGADPQVGAHLRVAGSVAAGVHGADGGHAKVVDELVQVRVVSHQVTVARAEDVEGALPVVAVGDPRVHGRLPERGGEA